MVEFITLDKIKTKALNFYFSFLQADSKNENYFPKNIPSNKGSFLDIEQQKELINNSKIKLGFGYEIEFKNINNRQEGMQTVIDKIVFNTKEDYLKFLKKENEFIDYKNNFNQLNKEFPLLKDWLITNPKKIIDNSLNWNDLIKVCKYFELHPKPSLYIRELPIEVHTKFIENNKGVLKELLDILIQDDINNDETQFEKRFNLKFSESLIRFRILDNIINSNNNLRSDLLDLTIPLSNFNILNLNVENILIVENLMTFLTIPKLKNTIVIFGSGFSILQIIEANWVKNKNIYYWGDIDSHGFEILSNLKKYFPNINSILMNNETLDRFNSYVVEGIKNKTDDLINLNPNELETFKIVKENNLRLEQEKIPQKYINKILDKYFLL